MVDGVAAEREKVVWLLGGMKKCSFGEALIGVAPQKG